MLRVPARFCITMDRGARRAAVRSGDPSSPVIVALVVLAGLAQAPPARAADATPEQLQFAAQEHDLGYRAYVAKQYDEAAVHFENAFFSAPNPAELRSAIRARHDAGERARAATLAAIGQRKYPNDAALTKLAQETLAWATPQVYQVHVTSTEECSVAVDEKVVAEERAKDFRFFVDPGHHDLSVGWSENRSTKVGIEATAAGSKDLALQPPPLPPAPLARPGLPELPPDQAPAGKPLPPGVFWTALGLTAVATGVTVWSGIDTENNPGASAVKADCVGQGTSCPKYQQGLSSQLRTNVLIAVSGGLGLGTAIVGIFFTRWSGSPPSERRAAASAVRVTPMFGLGQAGVEGTF